jgi:hypothetical protein
LKKAHDDLIIHYSENQKKYQKRHGDKIPLVLAVNKGGIGIPLQI